MPQPQPRLHELVLTRIVPDTWIDVNKLVGLDDADGVRGLGHTRHQMLTAPECAFFVWCTSNLAYPIALSREIGRKDLIIKTPVWLQESALNSPQRQPIVVDHAYAELQQRR